MKGLVSSLALIAVLAPAAQAQGPDQDKMRANFAAMLKHSWYTGGGWTTDFATAKKMAKETGKPILAYFTRTYSP